MADDKKPDDPGLIEIMTKESVKYTLGGAGAVGANALVSAAAANIAYAEAASLTVSRGLNMPPVKNQHYVPQFHLKGFSTDSKSACVFDKVTKKSFKTGVANIATEQHFYDLPPEFTNRGDPQAVETVLSIFENKYAIAIRDLLDEVKQKDGFTPGPSERNRTIAHFLVMQYCRTREFRDTFTYAIRELSSAVAKKHEFAQRYKAERGEVIKSENPIIPIPPGITPLEHARIMFDQPLIERIMFILFQHIWLIADNQTPQPFFTSDAPVMRQPHYNHPVYGGAGFGSKGVEILLPLSSRFLLVLLERTYFTPGLKETDGAVMHLKPEEVTYYNGFQVWESFRQIYCQEDKFDLAKDLVERYPEICDLEHSRISIMG